MSQSPTPAKAPAPAALPQHRPGAKWLQRGLMLLALLLPFLFAGLFTWQDWRRAN